ncbi:T7SS effector LXG polymorphic toxin [Enterococcus sp. AZ126]|uniref:T7SS effector LXG polymorphic toxin n=1 Tax=Enterococcus sp. AZ126 TaxID=2774635 RepID=UPI003F2891B1
MELDFYIGEVQAQANQTARMNNQASQAITSLQTSIQSFSSAPLTSKAYDAAKSYFMVAYTPLCQSAIMTGEALESANKRLLSDYQSMVCGIDTIKDEILEQIARFEEVKRDIDQQMSIYGTKR